MRNELTVFASIMIAALGLACGNGNQVSVERNDSGEPPNFGSATDIRAHSGENTTNTADAADIGIGGPMARASGNYQSQPIEGQASDEELAKKVKVALTTGSMGTTGVIAKDQLTAIEVSVQNGVVTLRGPVASEQERRTIEKQVAGMKGVRGVRNELTAGTRPTQGATDPLVPRGPGNQ